MASTSKVSPCWYYQDKSIPTQWCTNCEEGLSDNCEKSLISTRMSQSNRLMSTDGCFQAGEVCEDHDKQFEYYCTVHEAPLCLSCVPLSHKGCPGIIPLSEAAKNGNGLSALADIQKSIDRTLQDMNFIITDKDSELLSIDEKEKEIILTFNKIRNEINNHLDDLQEKFLCELEHKFKECKLKNTQSKDHLKLTAKTLNRLKEETDQLKNFSSDLQVFLASLQINKTVNEQIEKAVTEIRSVRTYHLEIVINSNITKLIKTNHELGNIKIVETNPNLSLRSKSLEQAQTPIWKWRNVTDTQLKLKQRFRIKQKRPSMHVTGCIIRPNADILLADYKGKHQLLVYNEKGEHIRDLPVSDRPWGLTVIDTDRIGVSYPIKQYVEIINITHNVVDKTIKLRFNCYGISYQDEKLYIIMKNEGIIVTDITGEILHTIKCDVSNVRYLTTTKNRIYYTDWIKNAVHCCSLTGVPVWTFKEKSIITPYGLSADNNQNVFVVGKHSNSLIMIQHDGVLSKVLLTESDGLNWPNAMCYDKDKKDLFVCNLDNRIAFLFNVIQ